VIVPLIDVVGIIAQSICCKHKPVVQAGPVAHVFGVVPTPQVWPDGQVPQLAVRLPQPSETSPHVAPACAQVRGVHEPLPLPLPPHVNSVPPPPQLSGDVQLPQSTWPPQPSPIGPHIAFCDAHVASVHAALPAASSKIAPSLGCVLASSWPGNPSVGAPLCVGPQPAIIKPTRRSERANCFVMGCRMLT
jgi:hypothetical protein